MPLALRAPSNALGQIVSWGEEGAILKPTWRLFLVWVVREGAGLHQALLGPMDRLGMEAEAQGRQSGRQLQEGLASAQRTLAPVQDHIAGCGPRCGGTAMQGKTKRPE